MVLSICVATYNRAEFIGATLDSVIPQLTDDVELLVVDGASTDRTEAVMEDYTRRSDRIRYVRLAAKGGIDRDYDLAVGHARGEYCWLLPDDDLMKPGAIDAVLAEIRKGSALVIVNAEVRNLDMSSLVEERRLFFTDDKFYAQSEFEQFFLDNIIYMTYIGCVVIRRNLWMEREREKYYGTEFIHVGVIFQKPIPGPISVIATPYLSIRLGNAQWTARAFEIWVFKWPTLIWSFNDISQHAKAKVYPREAWKTVTRLLFIRAEGNFGADEYRKFIRPKLSSSFERAKIRTVTLIPGPIVNILARIYYSFRASKNQYALFVLKSSRFNLFNTAKRSIS